MKLAESAAMGTWGEAHPLLEDVEKLKDLIYHHSRKAGYKALVSAIRLHVKSSKVAKQKYSELKMTVKNKLMKEPGEFANGSSEASGFIKMISDYKRKVRRIKRKIHEEEK